MHISWIEVIRTSANIFSDKTNEKREPCVHVPVVTLWGGKKKKQNNNNKKTKFFLSIEEF